MKRKLISDLTHALLKSVPTNVVLERSNEELILINSEPLAGAKDVPEKIKIMHEVVWLPGLDMQVKDPVRWVDGIVHKSIRYAGLAELTSYPSGYDVNKVKSYECPIDISVDEDILSHFDLTTDDNNFINQIAACRALYSWMTPEELYSEGTLVIERQTSTGLPLGDYSFVIKPFGCLSSRDCLPDSVAQKLPNGSNRWRPYADLPFMTPKHHIVYDASSKEYFDDVYPKNVIVRVSKDSRHGTSGSVDQQKTNGKKQKSKQGKDAPGPQLGM